MANCLLGYRNWAAAATLSGGSWQAARPLANLQDLVLARVARSADATTGSTVVVADLGQARAVRILGLAAHNLTASATQRWRGAASEAGLTAAPGWDSGAVAVWRGSDTPAANAGEDGLPVHRPVALAVADSDQSWRWWRLDLADTGNPDGFVEAGYLMLWQAWQPSRNFSYGKALGLETGTIRQESIGLVETHDRRASRRTERFAIENLPPADAKVALRIERERDLDRPVFWMPDPGAPDDWHDRAFLARLSVLGALDNPSLRRERSVWDLREVAGG
jgi:hypothetical protein